MATARSESRTAVSVRHMGMRDAAGARQYDM